MPAAPDPRLPGAGAAGAAEGFDLHERIEQHSGDEAWGWNRGDDDRWPCFLERRLAISWMRDRLRHSAVFTESGGPSD